MTLKRGGGGESFHEGKITVVAAMELPIRSVSKTYPNGVHALKDVTLTIKGRTKGSELFIK